MKGGNMTKEEIIKMLKEELTINISYTRAEGYWASAYVSVEIRLQDELITESKCDLP